MKTAIANNKKLIIFEIEENSSFTSAEHFLDSLLDLLNECEAKELDSNEIGFNADRLKELSESINLEPFTLLDFLKLRIKRVAKLK